MMRGLLRGIILRFVSHFHPSDIILVLIMIQKKYSNKLLVETIMSGATTLLTCFHYAHQGFAPFSMPDLEETQKFAKDEREYLGDIRPKLKLVGGEHVQDPAKELFWTSQLHTPNWRPLVLAT